MRAFDGIPELAALEERPGEGLERMIEWVRALGGADGPQEEPEATEYLQEPAEMEYEEMRAAAHMDGGYFVLPKGGKVAG